MIKFGTSGFRGIIDENFNVDNVQKIAFAFRELVCKKNRQVKIIIGHDNRRKGSDFAKCFCEAACCDQIRVTFMTVSVPTPFIAFKAKTFDYGVMITASHNPAQYNGLAFLLHGGRDADDGFSDEIVKLLDKTSFSATPFDELVKKGLIDFESSIDDYVDKVASMVDVKKIKKANLKILFNSMYGSGTDTVKKLFAKIGVKYNAINDTVDPDFGGRMPAPYAHNLVDMVAMVRDKKYDFGFALDGDGDRIVIIDGEGTIFDCNYLAAILVDQKRCGLVKAYLASNLAARVCKKYNLPLFETRVGFKFLGQLMEQTNTEIAAEQQGIGIKDLSLKKDAVGIVALVIDAVAKTDKTIGEMISEIATRVGFPSTCVEYAYYYRGDMAALMKKILSKGVPSFPQKIVARDDFPDGFRLRFEGDYWCAARASGTEDVIRLYTEMPTEKDCLEVIATLEKYYGLSEKQK
ncbi:MAG: hypothetical protein FWC00_04065 [Firmicutes bacterium]|nr:hypothetical protein [Bacillota bacterium]